MRVTITLAADDLKKVDAAAEELLISRSAMVRIAVVEYLRRKPKA